MKAKAKIYFEYGIRNQIAAGGSDDWQIRLGKYIVSLQYVVAPAMASWAVLRLWRGVSRSVWSLLYIREIRTARS